MSASSFPDLPTAESFPAQGPSPQTVGTRYAAVEYIEVMQRLPMGPQGPMGPTGPEGEDGAEWHFGAGDPNNNGTIATGPNDIYVDDSTGDVWAWEETSQAWVKTGANISGPTGPQGLQGIQGATGPTGPQGLQGGGILVVGEFPGNGSQDPGFTPGVPGEGWIDSLGNLWGWIVDPTHPDGGYWYNYGPIQGPTGPAGPGVYTYEVGFAFVDDPLNSLWSTQLIAHPLANPTPAVRTVIDYLGNGVYTDDQTFHVSYPSSTTVLLTAESTVKWYNPTGRVILQ